MFASHDAFHVEGAPCESLLAGDENAENFLEHPQQFESSPVSASICAPLGFNGGRSELTSRLRSALSPWFDYRWKADIIRDELDERARVLVRDGLSNAFSVQIIPSDPILI
jgi:hypothetical protein